MRAAVGAGMGGAFNGKAETSMFVEASGDGRFADRENAVMTGDAGPSKRAR